MSIHHTKSGAAGQAMTAPAPPEFSARTTSLQRNAAAERQSVCFARLSSLTRLTLVSSLQGNFLIAHGFDRLQPRLLEWMRHLEYITLGRATKSTSSVYEQQSQCACSGAARVRASRAN
jgi:hypothetical protein